jgi:hypothetical protein
VNEYPFQPFSEIQVHALSDVFKSLDQLTQRLQAAVTAAAR